MSAPERPLELVGPVPHRMSAEIHKAFRQALAGDFAALDRIELDYLNLLARIGELVIREADGTRHDWALGAWDAYTDARAPFVTAILRGYGPQARQALEWQLRAKCRRCDGKLRHLDCRVCGGRWYVDDMNDHPIVVTDLDGVVLED